MILEVSYGAIAMCKLQQVTVLCQWTPLLQSRMVSRYLDRAGWFTWHCRKRARQHKIYDLSTCDLVMPSPVALTGR